MFMGEAHLDAPDGIQLPDLIGIYPLRTLESIRKSRGPPYRLRI
jgi:hypothetical protein